MGFWGFAPFQNDYALDEYGGYNTSRHLTGLIWQGIKRGGNYSIDVHEIMGMILRTFKVYDGICSEADEVEMIKAIATGVFTQATKQAMSGETPMMIMSCATIDFEERKKMLEYAANKMMGIIEKNNSSSANLKGNPKSLEDFFNIDSQKSNLFNADKLWVKVETDEESIEYQKIYNLARSVINNDFEDVINPMQITDEQLAWLVEMEKDIDKLEYINNYKQNYPAGITDVRIRMNETWRVSNSNLSILEINPRDLYGATTSEIGINVVSGRDWMPIHFKNGFYYSHDRLISIDSKMPLVDDIGNQIMFTRDTVKAVAQYVPVYKTKAEYEAAMKKKAKTENKSGITCTNKFYKGNKIVAYELTQVNTGQKIVVNPDALKAKIYAGAIKVDNMKLTSDNRLITL